MTDAEHPYSLVYEKDGVAYVSGATTIDYATHLPVEGDEAALDTALNEVERRLGTIGLDLAAVTKVTYFLSDMRLRSIANAQFEKRFVQPRPARTVVGVSSIPYGGIAVIDAIAQRSRARVRRQAPGDADC
ncbi:RidA family protein [Bradyrhizobium sp. Leo121]|uniref:RidA family protein n=1 Tax=Bradyrhizobium sp. Leo121 TaxID=1571195 RepID=UPI001A91D8FB|nr:RidA family protein [Bradyrhizobium sp. Leo121]